MVEVADVHGRDGRETAAEGVGRTGLPHLFNVVLNSTSTVSRDVHVVVHKKTYWWDVQQRGREVVFVNADSPAKKQC